MKFNFKPLVYDCRALYLFCISIASLQVFATPETLTLQSRIIKPDGSALETSSTNFRISITDPVGTCVVFQEDFAAINLSGTKGLATLNVGAGTKAYPAGPLTMTQVFDNSAAANFVCQSGGNYDPGTTDKRKLIMQFNDGSGWQTLPPMSVNSVPFALHASSANSLSGLLATDLVQFSNVPTCVGGQALHFNGTSFTCVAVGGGSGSVTSVTSANTDIAITNTTTTPQLTLNVGTGNNQIVKLNGSAELPAVSGANLTALNAANLGSGTVPAARMPALTGDVEMTAGTTATSIAAGAIVDADINASAAIARTKIAAEGGAGAGNVLVNDGSGNISSLQCNDTEVIKFNGAGVATCGTDNAGTGDIVNGGNTGAVTIGTNNATALTLETDNSPRFSILANGNVGVGTTNPGSRFEVNGDVRLSSGADRKIEVTGAAVGNGNALTISSGAADTSGVSTSGALTLTTADIPGISGSSGSVIIRTGNAGGFNGQPGSISLLPASSNDIAWQGGEINLTAGNNDGGGSGGNVIVNPGSGSTNGSIILGNLRGYVGIGTTSPQRMLHTAGPIRITPTSVPASPAAGDIYVDSGDANKLKYHDGSG